MGQESKKPGFFKKNIGHESEHPAEGTTHAEEEITHAEGENTRIEEQNKKKKPGFFKRLIGHKSEHSVEVITRAEEAVTNGKEENEKKQPGFFKRLFSNVVEPSNWAFKDLEKQYRKKYGVDENGTLNSVGLGVSPNKIPTRVPKKSSKKPKDTFKSKIKSFFSQTARTQSKKPHKGKSTKAPANSKSINLDIELVSTPNSSTEAPTNNSAQALQMVKEYGWDTPGPVTQKPGMRHPNVAVNCY